MNSFSETEPIDMGHKELSEALDVVHRELSQSDHLDQDDVQQLRGTMSKIQTALSQEVEPQPEPAEEGLSDHIAHSAERFEQTHPRLTETLGRIADMLQQMGI